MRYIQLSLETSRDRADVAAEIISRVAGGVAIHGAFEALDQEGTWGYRQADTGVTIQAYLAADGRERERAAEVGRLLKWHGFTAPARRWIEDGDWAAAWKAFFPIQRIGRVVIRPPWRSYSPRQAEVVVDLDPGMAFGTGQHPTTWMCVRALQALVQPGFRVLDVGTGSGILALVAARLGANEVLALDTDPVAVTAVTANADRNGLGHIVHTRLGSLTEAVQGAFDVVVANISAAVILDLAPSLTRATAESGALICGGLLDEGARSVRTEMALRGMMLCRRHRKGDWRTLVMTHA